MYCVGKEEGTERKAVLLGQGSWRERDKNEMWKWSGPGRGCLLVKGVGLYFETEWKLQSHWCFLEDLSVCCRETDKQEARVDALS